MKKHHEPRFITTGSEKEANNFLQEDDIVTAGSNPPRQRTFTAAELWNIQRQKRTVVHPVYLM